VFKNRVLRAMIGPWKEEVIENRNWVFRSLMVAMLTKCAGDQTKMNEKCWTRGPGGLEEICIHRFGGGNLKNKRPLKRPRRRLEDNIKIYLNEVR